MEAVETLPSGYSSHVKSGDVVRINRNELTEKAGVAGFIGAVNGFSTPSCSDLNVIGDEADKCAVKLHLEVQQKDIWINPELLKHVDHAAGTVVHINGLSKKMQRNSSGEWIEVMKAKPIKKKKPWWKFW